MTNRHLQSLAISTLVTLLAIAACSGSSSDQEEASGGSGGSAEPLAGGAGNGGSAESAGVEGSAEGGVAGEGGSFEAGQGGASGEGGFGGYSDEGGAGGSLEEPDDCELPIYLQNSHIVAPGVGRPVIEYVVDDPDMMTVPFGAIVRYSKFDSWRCEHKPFCDYAVQSPSATPLPITERYWQPVYWQGNPPDGKKGEWVGLCTLDQWEPHGTCGGFYREGDYTNYRDPTDLYAERYLWQCRVGWEAACDTQPPGTGTAWVNVSATLHCYGY